MFRLAHISDLHISPMPNIHLHELLSKRLTGYVNWHQHRKKFHQVEILNTVIEQIKQNNPDHIAITGDLVNIATKAEIDQATKWLQTHCDQEMTSLVPGNHDAYHPGAFKKSVEAWSAWIFGAQSSAPKKFPYLKKLNQIAIIGFSTSNATLPFRATGNFTQNQADAGKKLLQAAKEDGLFRIILIHHPPYKNATHSMKRMIGISRFNEMLASDGAELILHGHTHLNTTHVAHSSGQSIPTIGISSASQAPGDKKPVAGYNLFDIDKTGDNWRCRHRRLTLDVSSNTSNVIEENIF